MLIIICAIFTGIPWYFFKRENLERITSADTQTDKQTNKQNNPRIQNFLKDFTFEKCVFNISINSFKVQRSHF